MVLAIVCVYLSHRYAYQWLIWTVLSLGQVFLLSKFEPFGDRWMNIVCIVNELFVFFAMILLMPLANNLSDLDGRDNVGWCLYGVLLLCILFNIVILLLRSCGLLCEYHRSRIELVQILQKVELPREEVSNNPFEDKELEKPAPNSPRMVVPICRDFQTFGMKQNVEGSLTSFQLDESKNFSLRDSVNSVYSDGPKKPKPPVIDDVPVKKK